MAALGARVFEAAILDQLQPGFKRMSLDKLVEGVPPEVVANLAPLLGPAADHAKIDALEEAALGGALAAVEMENRHDFIPGEPGFYARTIYMHGRAPSGEPAWTIYTSKVHRTLHTYQVTAGRVTVFIPGEGPRRIEAPFAGVTQPGTRRVLLMAPGESCTWTTFHPIAPEEQGDVAAIEARIIEPRLLPDGTSAHGRYLAQLAEAQALTDGEVRD